MGFSGEPKGTAVASGSAVGSGAALDSSEVTTSSVAAGTAGPQAASTMLANISKLNKVSNERFIFFSFLIVKTLKGKPFKNDNNALLQIRQVFNLKKR